MPLLVLRAISETLPVWLQYLLLAAGGVVSLSAAGGVLLAWHRRNLKREVVDPICALIDKNKKEADNAMADLKREWGSDVRRIEAATSAASDAMRREFTDKIDALAERVNLDDAIRSASKDDAINGVGRRVAEVETRVTTVEERSRRNEQGLALNSQSITALERGLGEVRAIGDALRRENQESERRIVSEIGGVQQAVAALRAILESRVSK